MDGRVSARIATPFGVKTYPVIQPGKVAEQAFNTRQDAVDAGTASVVVTSGSGADATTMTFDVPYAAASCD
ncbi:hypothetical protein [Raineyella sp. LH-20]|uniref:hypothetical protein n=1 Tax=Raineyella sp. LH-20 TaxID=3081204 RepID=UPI0029543F68|nr:hypothetical protein [Raineyella sp. LH-20]WOP17824.1 hypothetical protein R0146_11260 [Raineyella sp. LH-20]